MPRNKKRGRKAAATAAPPPSKDEERGTVQMQVYPPVDLVEFHDSDRAVREGEIRDEMGSQRTLSRSAHVVANMHQYRLLRLAGPNLSWSECWEVAKAAVAAASANKKKGKK